MTDAVVRTLWRLCVTHTRMLEWTPTMHEASRVPHGVGGFYRRMVGSLLLTGIAAAAVALRRPDAWPVAAPLRRGAFR